MTSKVDALSSRQPSQRHAFRLQPLTMCKLAAGRDRRTLALLGVMLVSLWGPTGALLGQSTEGAAAPPTPSVSASPATPSASGPFAWPWEISFDLLDQAMSRKSYRVTQIRRVLDRQTPGVQPTTWIEVIERLSHLAATATTPEAFDLQFVGVPGLTMTPSQLQFRARQFQQVSGFLYHFQSFRVFDAMRASSNYKISFLGLSARIERPVYVLAIYSTLGQRSGWLVEADIETGYPLYCGEYDLTNRLVGELVVETFDPAYAGPLSLNQELPGTQRFADPVSALRSAGIAENAAPAPVVLPAGYSIGSAKTIIDPFSGAKRVVLIYSDGIDQIFVVIKKDQRASLAEGHTVAYYRDAAGTTQCSFVDRGVEFLVVGRGFDQPLRDMVNRFYAQVAR